MLLAPAVVFAQVLIAIHIIFVVAAFGILFGFPLLVIGVSQRDPSVLPALYRARQFAGRALVNPGLILVLAFGIWTTAKLHQWHQFYVQWGIAAVIVIGALEGAIVVRGSGKLAAASETGTGGVLPAELVTVRRRVDLAGVVMAVIVLVTVYLMAVQA
jgi:hypothetical protein